MLLLLSTCFLVDDFARFDVYGNDEQRGCGRRDMFNVLHQTVVSANWVAHVPIRADIMSSSYPYLPLLILFCSSTLPTRFTSHGPSDPPFFASSNLPSVYTFQSSSPRLMRNVWVRTGRWLGVWRPPARCVGVQGPLYLRATVQA